MDTSDFRFDYEKHQSKSVSIDDIDKMISAIIGASGTIALIILWLKAMAITSLLIVRGKLVNEQQRIDRQNYEIKRRTTNSQTIEADDLD